MRFDKWIEAWNLFLTSPLIGLGPLREEIASSTDNFYLYLLVRVGIVGLFIYLLLISFLLRISFLMMKQENDSFGLYFMLLTALILAANFMLEAQILVSMSYLYFVVTGILLAKYNNRNFSSTENLNVHLASDNDVEVSATV